MILRCHCDTDVLIPAAGPHQLPSAPDFHLPPCLHLLHLNFGWEMRGVYSSITIQLTGAPDHSLVPGPMHLPCQGPASFVSLGLVPLLCL